ncbi:hypothetical protein BDY17DRAFT_311365 [Neohortaea acidophila]|uniref:Uncharacterized protein n=1 Tax=Neohortaea acidophila TaxID=245834 RepID=A0A6A6PR69_9PEZI|nr:uncharacterized protein BDY17DRAFT_311365 [Neohortaea acidophila]KAF2481707.1 hypothetical protein BDY17DRAFT_311365 [Neohortaea acidophila]
MSSFVNADDDFPPLKLVPSNADLAQPTIRGRIEERQEKKLHQRSGSKDSRTPVFASSPQFASTDFAKRPNASKSKLQSGSDVSIKTPKKGLLGRLKLPGNMRSHASPSTPNLCAGNEQAENRIPNKAQEVLGATHTAPPSLGSSPSKISIPRSPSKRKHFFSRKNASATAVDDPVPKSADTVKSAFTASTYINTPPTAFSDPTHYSFHPQNKRIVSQSNSDKGGDSKAKDPHYCLITRSQSLKYFDHHPPPTPPAKNTPPDEKARRDAAIRAESSRMPFHGTQTSPFRESTGVISVSGRWSPTKFGGYAHKKEMPTLVTKPSVYSLHASVVPNLTEADTFEEMKARIDGLGLEGFSMPRENERSSTMQFEHVYSPSIYSEDWGVRPTSVLVGGQQRVGKSEMAQRTSNGTSMHTKGSSSSGGEIPICYPGLAKDPSVGSMNTPNKAAGLGKQPQRLEAHRPQHGKTHSRDHSLNSRRSAAEQDSSIFARHVEDNATTVESRVFDSPTSFNHPSAAPSPLHLQAATYTPPPRMSSKFSPGEVTAVPTDDKNPSNTGLRITTKTPAQPNIFTTLPSLPRPTTSPTTDPLKPSPTSSPTSNKSTSANTDRAKLDHMLAILSQLQTRHAEMDAMRDELRAANERLEGRLTAVEGLARGERSRSASVEADVAEFGAEEGGRRIATATAVDFYRAGQGHGSERDDDGEEDDGQGESGTRSEAGQSAESETIAELRETNRRLLEMVGGFEEQIQRLERRVGGGGM